MKNKKYKNKRQNNNRRKATLLAIGLSLSVGLVFNQSVPTLEAAVQNENQETQETKQTQFFGKETLANHPIVRKEQNNAIQALINRWEENNLASIKSEIQRQEEAGSLAYVAQWGDTLLNIAEASGTSVDELLTANGLNNSYEVVTGDILVGVMDNDELLVAGDYYDDDWDDWDDDDWDDWDDDWDDDDWDDWDDDWDDDDWDDWDDDWDDDDWDDWDDDDYYEDFYDDDWDDWDDDWDDDDWVRHFYSDPNNIPGHRPQVDGDLPSTSIDVVEQSQPSLPTEANPNPNTDSNPSTNPDNNTNTNPAPEQNNQPEQNNVPDPSANELPPIDSSQTGQNSFDTNAVMTHFHQLVNDERARNGAHSLAYGDHMQTAALNRNEEITVQFSHTRPNGQSFHTAPGFEQGGSIVGENLQQTYVSQGTSPEAIAQELFINWKNSSGHYENMMDTSYTNHAIQIDSYQDGNNTIIYATQVFSN